MKSYKIWLHEKRKNPEQNPKINVYERLKKYFDKNNIYISMRDINKLGINPKSKFDTPNGIYSYNLNDYKNVIEKNKNLSSSLPYQSKAEFVYVFSTNVDVLKLSEITEDWVKNFIKKTLQKFPKFKILYLENVHIIKNIEKQQRLIKDLKQSLIKNGSLNFDEFIADAAIKIFYGDDEESTIIEKLFDIKLDKIKPFNVGTITTKLLRLKLDFDEIFNRINSLIEELRKQKEQEEEKLIHNNDLDGMVNKIYSIGKYSAKVINHPSGIFWWFTYEVVGSNPNKWNGFFREMEIYGIEDDEGYGVIHKAEPFQTVFFDKTKLKVLEVIENKDYIKRYKFKGMNFFYIEENGILIFKYMGLEQTNLQSLEELPWVQEGKQYKVEGNFYCNFNYLTTLKGSPISVGGDFNCENNRLKTIEGIPKHIGGDFICKSNYNEFSEEEIREKSNIEGKIYN